VSRPTVIERLKLLGSGGSSLAQVVPTLVDAVTPLADRLKAAVGLSASYVPPHPGRAVQGSWELDRIKALPRRNHNQGWVDLSATFTHTPGPCNGGCGLCDSGEAVGLRPIQSQALGEALVNNGLLGPIGVGHGKELITLLLPEAMNSRRAVIMTEPSLVPQLMDRDIPRYRRHFVVPDATVYPDVSSWVNVVKYSTLSSQGHADVLEKIQPDLIICNEAHALKDHGSARTKRFLRYLDDHPECRVVFLSGSMTTRSLNDYAHLAHRALRARSPLPAKWTDLQAWASALDVPNKRNPAEGQLHPGALLTAFPCWHYARAGGYYNCGKLHHAHSPHGISQDEMDVIDARCGFRDRLTSTPGVIATSDSGATMGLTLSTFDPGPIPLVVTKAMSHVSANWETPGGETVFEDGAAVSACMSQLAMGFYYVWDWAAVGGRDQAWLDARNAWARTCRAEITNRPGKDTAGLIENLARAGELSPEAQAVWDAWVPHQDKPEPPTVPVWLDTFAVQAAFIWASARSLRDKNGIIWYTHKAVGEKLAELSWLPHFGEGDDAGTTNPVDSPVIICGPSQRTGKNLQEWDHNLIITPPSGGGVWEQLLGRTHRPGQQADNVTADIMLHTPHLQLAFQKAVDDARYIEQTTGSRQKLLLARDLTGLRG